MIYFKHGTRLTPLGSRYPSRQTCGQCLWLAFQRSNRWSCWNVRRYFAGKPHCATWLDIPATIGRRMPCDLKQNSKRWQTISFHGSWGRNPSFAFSCCFFVHVPDYVGSWVLYSCFSCFSCLVRGLCLCWLCVVRWEGWVAPCIRSKTHDRATVLCKGRHRIVAGVAANIYKSEQMLILDKWSHDGGRSCWLTIVPLLNIQEKTLTSGQMSPDGTA